MGSRGFSSMRFTAQERLSKDDIRLLIKAVETSSNISSALAAELASPTRVELMLDKLKRMEKQK